MRNVYKILEGKSEGKRPLGRHRRRWKGVIGMDLMEIRWEGAGWIHLTQNSDQWHAIVNKIMKLRVSIKGEEFLE
jgi:hypothetical protein